MSEYFDLHTQGIGYLNRVREVRPKNGSPFWACDIVALHGSKDNLNHTRFDCRVSGAQAIALVQQYQDAVEQDRKVLIGFRLGDLYADTFTYSKGERAGETGVRLKSRLLYIGFIKIDGETVYSAETAFDDGEEPESQKGNSGSETAANSDAAAPVSDPDRMPAEVQLSKDDPDFQERKAELKDAGYRFDGQDKVWRLPTATAAV
ncbi:STY4534 family ICE replication protein [Salinisphaera hydrothermalis]|uniref:STY4534 family ICE replication protein n=1 Tax=Salinisphaera TaxID=180541 RepID=UPI0033429632